jgi:dihydrofolate reductase
VHDELAQPQTIVFGRVTYELLSRMSAKSGDEGSRRMTELPKIVVSTTLREPLEWTGSRLVRSLEELRELKGQSGPPLRCMGSLTLVRALIEHGLLDRLRLVVFPQVLGESGREPAFAGLPDIGLELADQRVLDGRLVLLDYRPLTRPAPGRRAVR